MNRIFYLHIEEEASDEHIYKTYLSTQKAVKNKEIKVLHSYDILSLSFDLLEEGFTNLFVILPDKIIEVKLGSDNTWTEKELRVEHNVYKMIVADILREDYL